MLLFLLNLHQLHVLLLGLGLGVPPVMHYELCEPIRQPSCVCIHVRWLAPVIELTDLKSVTCIVCVHCQIVRPYFTYGYVSYQCIYSLLWRCYVIDSANDFS